MNAPDFFAMKILDPALGQRLKRALRAEGISVPAVAAALDQSRQSVYKYLNGTTALRADVLEAILGAFPQLDRDSILSGDGKRPSDGAAWQRIADLERENATLRELVESQKEVIGLLRGKGG
ncbi:MAG: XRE family transcriptional regulator [Bacteroidetes bacterium]|nr:MAG: XRE family transcriptional regulator [Bacteroidota bacterium]